MGRGPALFSAQLPGDKVGVRLASVRLASELMSGLALAAAQLPGSALSDASGCNAKAINN